MPAKLKLPEEPLCRTLNAVRIAELFYPIIVAQLMDGISEAKAAELIGQNVENYRETKASITSAVLHLVEELPSPLLLLLDCLKGRQPSSTRKSSSSKSTAKGADKGSGSRKGT